jgi:RNA polymerase sigma-70 factor, ECF subfamily
MTDDEGSTMGEGCAAHRESTIRRQVVNAAGDGLDIVDLVRQYHAVVYRYAYRLTLSVADAEDLAQQTFLVAQQRLSQVRQPEKVERWLLAVLRSCFLKEYRKRIPTPVEDLEMEMDVQRSESGPGERVDREQLDQALAELPDSFRLVLTMHYFEDLAYKEIARQLGIPIGTVMSRLSRAKRHLRRYLECRQTVSGRTADG